MVQCAEGTGRYHTAVSARACRYIPPGYCRLLGGTVQPGENKSTARPAGPPPAPALPTPAKPGPHSHTSNAGGECKNCFSLGQLSGKKSAIHIPQLQKEPVSVKSKGGRSSDKFSKSHFLQISGLLEFARLANLLQIWRFADPLLFVVCKFAVCGSTLFLLT